EEGRRQIGPDHDHGPVGEVDKSHRPVDEREAHRHEGVDRTEAEPSDERLDGDLHRSPQLEAATSVPLVITPMEVAEMPTPVSSKEKLPSRPVRLVARIASASACPRAT